MWLKKIFFRTFKVFFSRPVLTLLNLQGLDVRTGVIMIGISFNLVPRACDPREGTRGSGIIRCRKPGILAKIELRIPIQRPIRFLPETDYPRASRSFPRIAGSGNEIGISLVFKCGFNYKCQSARHLVFGNHYRLPGM
jgi:hypothetical protein